MTLNRDRTIITIVAIYLAAIAGVATPLLLQPTLSPELQTLLAFAIAAIAFLVTRRAMASSLQSRQDRIAKRKANRQRSPWGEIRTTEPSPFNDRLSSFIVRTETTIERQAAAANAIRQSGQLWCNEEQLASEPTDPKPTWFIRRLLNRIRDAVRG